MSPQDQHLQQATGLIHAKAHRDWQNSQDLHRPFLNYTKSKDWE